jgi:predicted ATPase
VKRFVLTGGHGVGKTSLIRELEARGETITDEAAQDVRLRLEAHGAPFPMDRDDFESLCLTLHRQREDQVPSSGQRVFHDRGAPDHLAYAELGNWTLSADEISYCLAARYDAVFLVLPHDRAATNLSRIEQLFSDRLTHALHDLYTVRLGMVVHEVPPGDLSDRVNYVLDQCTNA